MAGTTRGTTATLGKDLATLVSEIRAPGCWRDPYPYYRRLREHGPVVRTADGRLVITGHRACHAVLTNPGWEHFPELLCMSGQVFGQEAACPVAAQPPRITDSLPDRQSLRERLSRQFTPRAILRLRPRIESIVSALADQLAGQRAFDFIDAFAMPLTATVLAEAFGVPPVDQQTFRKWSSILRGAAESSVSLVSRKVSDAEVAQASREVDGYLKGLIARRRAAPGDDLLSMLLCDTAGQRWNDDQIAAVITSIIIVGHHTTTAFIGNGALALSRHPDRFGQLRDRPELAGPAVEELLRYDAPAQFVSRFAQKKMHLEDHPIVPGDVALLFIGAANRDPASFAGPDQLDFGRAPNDHLAFSQGHAYCFGAPLARLAGSVAFATLARRFARLEPDGEPVYFGTIGLRGIAVLPLRT
ncbi:MAG TPA: cytochrome P450 [Streptosporangiaceae bacterium]|jgi:hypothetical protein